MYRWDLLFFLSTVRSPLALYTRPAVLQFLQYLRENGVSDGDMNLLHREAYLAAMLQLSPDRRLAFPSDLLKRVEAEWARQAR